MQRAYDRVIPETPNRHDLPVFEMPTTSVNARKSRSITQSLPTRAPFWRFSRQKRSQTSGLPFTQLTAGDDRRNCISSACDRKSRLRNQSRTLIAKENTCGPARSSHLPLGHFAHIAKNNSTVALQF